MDLNTQHEVHLSHYWNIIQKRWKVAASILAVVMLGTFLASYFSKPLYRSQIQLQIERESPNQLTIEDLFGIAPSEQEFLQTQFVLLRSRGLAQRVIDDAKLLNDPQFYPPGIAGKTPAEVRQIRDGMVGALLGGIEVVPVRNTALVDIFYTASSPELARKVAQQWGESYIRMNVEKKLQTVEHASRFLAQQIEDVKKDLDTSRAQMQRYGESKDIIALDGGTGTGADNVVAQRLVQLNEDVIRAANERIEKQAAYSALTRTSPSTVAAGDPLVMQLSSDLSRLEREYDQLLGTLQPGHPRMVQLKGEVDKARAARDNAIRQAYGKALENAREQAASAASREGSVRAAFEGAKRETQTLNTNAATLLDLRTEVQTRQTLLATLQKQLSETEVSARLRGSAGSNIYIAEEAQQPGGRVNVTMKKNLQNAFPLGLILGLAAVFFLEYMDRSVKTPEELERVTRFASLGVIPAAASVSRPYGQATGRGTANLRPVESEDGASVGVELIPHTDSRSPVSEAYRAFRTSLLLASANSPKVIVITSSFAREGKTTTSVNLATVLAQMGKPVLLVDADLRRPRIQKVFRGKMNLGLVNYLAANIPLDDVIQETDVPNLSVVLSGPIPPNPSELLASDRMKHLIEEIRSKFAYVIFDSPPVLAVTDAVVLAANADGVVLCVHGGQTPRELVQRSAERLRNSNIPVLGAILNNLDLSQYGYTYRKSYYDYYDSDDSAEAQPKRKTV
jgi:succinoglycan biosynthesis transport protein ExoP